MKISFIEFFSFLFTSQIRFVFQKKKNEQVLNLNLGRYNCKEFDSYNFMLMSV